MENLRKIAALALDALKAAGADDACVTAITTETREFNVDAGEFTLFRTLFDNSLRMTAFKDKKKGTAALNRFDEESIRAAAKDCLETAVSGAPDECWQLAPEGKAQDWADGCYKPDLDRFFARSQELMDTVRTDYPRILVTQFVLDHKGEREVYLNTRGAAFTSESGGYSVSMDFSGHDGEQGSSFFCTGFGTVDLDRPFIDQYTVRQDLESAVASIETTPVSGKFTGTVVLQPGCLADLLGTALESFTGDAAMISGTSIWKDKLHQQVASEKLTVRMAPLDPRIQGGERWTGEGYVSEDYTLIEKGSLNCFMLSQYGANRTGLDRAKNTDGAMIVEQGTQSLDEIIAGIEYGLLVGRFSGGAPSNNGDFSGVAKNSFRIQNGKLTGAVSETMISGNLAEMFRNVRAISKETAMDGGSVLPWLAADGIVISGQ